MSAHRKRKSATLSGSAPKSPTTAYSPYHTPPLSSKGKASLAGVPINRNSYPSLNEGSMMYINTSGFPSPPFPSPSYATPPLASPLFESPGLASTSLGSSSYTSPPYPSPPYASPPALNVSPSQLTAMQGTDPESESNLRFIVSYTSDLPSLSEVKAACDCYVDECGENGASLQLCYVNRGQLDEIWLHLCSMQISKIELAFLYGVLANVGVGTPVAHPRYRLDSLRSAESQEKFIKNATEILENETSLDDEESKCLFTRCQALALVAWYHQGAAQYDTAWKYMKQAVQAAHTCQLFDLQEWLDATPAKLFTVKVLQMDIPYMFNWLAYSQERFSSFEPNFPDPGVLVQINDNPLEQALLRHKVEGSYLARKVSLKCHQSKNMSRKAVIKLAIELDDDILTYMESHSILRDVPAFLKINSNNRESIRLAASVVNFRGGMMLIRYRMMLSFFQSHSLDLFQHIALSSARTTLRMLMLVQRSFDSHWQSVMNKSWIDGFFNESMFIFLAAIRSHLYEAPPLAASIPASLKAGGSSSKGLQDERHSDSIRAELVWFMSNFRQLYDGMNKLGFVRQALIDCADELRKTPVQRPISDDAPSTLTTTSTNTNTTTKRRNLSAIPIVELSMDDLHKNSKLQQSSQMFQNEYVSYTVFKAAFSAHSRQNSF